ncbi:hypothetical protein ACFSJ3_09535 [Corallincola platygyrae]|uniref:AsmA family protein n=1 Tax=Corallincola platygyrae TaxID=1193278 RepID=A0ABW4XKY3_9GAMM
MKAGKWLLGGLAVIVIVVGVLVFGVLGNLDSIVKSLVEKVGTKVTHVEVTLDSVSIKLLDGRGELKGLTLANPDGFDSDYLFDLSDIVLDIDPGSLAGPVYVINEIKVDGAKLIAEQKGTTTNLQTLLNGMKKEGDQGAQPEADPEAESSEAPDVKLAVEKLTLSNNAITLITEQWGEKKLTMPTIDMSNLGNKDNGLTPEQLTSEIVSRVTRAVEKRVTQELKKMAEEKVKEKAKGELLKQLGG